MPAAKDQLVRGFHWTPDYRALEGFLSQPFDPLKVNLQSVGVVLFRMVMANLPLKRAAEMELQRSVLCRVYPELENLQG